MNAARNNEFKWSWMRSRRKLRLAAMSVARWLMNKLCNEIESLSRTIRSSSARRRLLLSTIKRTAPSSTLAKQDPLTTTLRLQMFETCSLKCSSGSKLSIDWLWHLFSDRLIRVTMVIWSQSSSFRHSKRWASQLKQANSTCWGCI